MFRRMKMPLLVCFGVLLALASCARESATISEDNTVQAATSELPKPAADFTLKDAEGRDVKLSDYKGKVVLLNFWATWCGPCKIEMPWFVDFQRKYKDRGFSVIAVSLDDEGWEVVRPFTDRFELNFPVVVGSNEMADQYGGIAALPTTFIINKEGQIVISHMGLVGRGEYEEDIEGLL
ncbi:MAG: TlpA disulfide reductase family protein [Acidobacteria bacterium]|nr:TlpA disulfide reductase family protein [Acidobacteriota bacterium]